MYFHNIYMHNDIIGGQRGGSGGPSPPPFHKNWSEKATKRVNFSKFSWTQQHLKSRPPPLLKSSDRAWQRYIHSLIVLRGGGALIVCYFTIFLYDWIIWLCIPQYKTFVEVSLAYTYVAPPSPFKHVAMWSTVNLLTFSSLRTNILHVEIEFLQSFTLHLLPMMATVLELLVYSIFPELSCKQIIDQSSTRTV